jgi:glucuronate isomerase
MHHTNINAQQPIFMGENFLLSNDFAAELYHDYAAALPIIDYHCHLSPGAIAINHRFKNLTEIWLEGDHYKWRAMRTNGVSEHYITGSATAWEKFEQWAKTVPSTLRNPLFHWTHLELQRYFGVKQILQPITAHEIFEQANDLLQQPHCTTQGILQKWNVEVVCTTDDPTDDLAAHQQFRQAQSGITPTKMYPTFRPDKATLIEHAGFLTYIQTLETVTNQSIHTYSNLLDALHQRMDFFATLGCRLSDHGLEQVYAADCTEAEADRIFRKRHNSFTSVPCATTIPECCSNLAPILVSTASVIFDMRFR